MNLAIRDNFGTEQAFCKALIFKVKFHKLKELEWQTQLKWHKSNLWIK